jgi:hypothetical protein
MCLRRIIWLRRQLCICKYRWLTLVIHINSIKISIVSCVCVNIEDKTELMHVISISISSSIGEPYTCY